MQSNWRKTKKPQTFQIIWNKYNSPIHRRYKSYASKELQFYLLNLGLLIFFVMSLFECIPVASKTTWKKKIEENLINIILPKHFPLTLIFASIPC